VLTQVSRLPSASIGAESSDSASVIVSYATFPAHHRFAHTPPPFVLRAEEARSDAHLPSDNSSELFRELFRVLRADGKLVLEEAGISQVRVACCALQV
jgi:hypothetical protein